MLPIKQHPQQDSEVGEHERKLWLLVFYPGSLMTSIEDLQQRLT